MRRDRLFTAAKWLVTILNILNVVAAVALVALFAITFAIEARLLAGLARRFGAEAEMTLAAMRGAVVLGLVCAGAVYVILMALHRMLRSAEEGDPFVPENARRLHAIGWALLAVQLIDLAIGVLSLIAPGIGGNAMPGWEPSVTGWIAVVMAFVLARVFVQGTRMRDELEMTV